MKIPLRVAIPDYLRDHRYEGRIVLPAAEALQMLARTLPPELPGCNPLRQEGGTFAHLLLLDAKAAAFSAFHETDISSDGRRLSRLTTLRTGQRTRWTRSIEHASVVFLPCGGPEGESGKETARPTGDAAPARTEAEENPTPEARRGAFSGHPAPPAQQPQRGLLVGDAHLLSVRQTGEGSGARRGCDFQGSFTFSARRLYADLVPFGPAYHNVVGEVCLTPAGASAEVSGGDFPDAVGPLGSPFVFDAALHVACAWGQRYRNVVAFPVGFHRREILLPTRNGEIYRCQVFPLPDDGAALRYNIRLYDRGHRTAEIIGGMRMRDISGGRLRPPAWVREGL